MGPGQAQPPLSLGAQPPPPAPALHLFLLAEPLLPTVKPQGQEEMGLWWRLGQGPRGLVPRSLESGVRQAWFPFHVVETEIVV